METTTAPFDLASQPLSYAFPDYDDAISPLSPSASASAAVSASSSPPAKKKRSHGKTRPPGHIPRPPNAFIIYRTEYIKSMGTHSTPEISKSLGDRWKSMSAAQKRPWIEKAALAKELHARLHPGYKYKPVHPRDEQGKCIRKPRRPNRPRQLVTPSTTAPTSHPSPSPSSSTSPPPPPSPSPTPANSFLPLRRSSSVPLPSASNDYPFFLPPPPADLRRRPSTSMDFACQGFPQDLPQQQWRPAHRRSISAPNSLPPHQHSLSNAQFLTAPPLPESDYLTPINPLFCSVFDNFSWDNPSSSASSSTSTSSTSTSTTTAAAGLPQIVPPLPPYAAAGLHIPSSPSPSSASPGPFSAAPGPFPAAPAPTLKHPVPVPAFDVAAYEYADQYYEFPPAPQYDAAYPQQLAQFEHLHLHADPSQQQLGQTDAGVHHEQPLVHHQEQHYVHQEQHHLLHQDQPLGHHEQHHHLHHEQALVHHDEALVHHEQQPLVDMHHEQQPLVHHEQQPLVDMHHEQQPLVDMHHAHVHHEQPLVHAHPHPHHIYPEAHHADHPLHFNELIVEGY